MAFKKGFVNVDEVDIRVMMISRKLLEHGLSTMGILGSEGLNTENIEIGIGTLNDSPTFFIFLDAKHKLGYCIAGIMEK